MSKIESFQNLIQQKIKELDLEKSPVELYAPMKYALTMGGKRIRPLLTLLSCDMFGANVREAIPAAIALEVFHNFTLVHDDIMDVAPIRRGYETVYKKWNQNIGILAGDAMLAKAFEILVESNEVHIKQLVGLLSRVAVEVCEGQQLDMNFENSEMVSLPEYLNMIRLKTAVLTASALMAGAIVANTSEKNQKEIYHFGENLGIAFQIKDDILDVYADENKFGKKTGNDIITRKKTFLYLSAHALATGRSLSLLKKHFSDTNMDDVNRVKEVIEIYDQLKVKEIAESKVAFYYKNALANLDNIDIPENSKVDLYNFAEKLMIREY
jgi:geranylgeranyl diphosphate synthase, type II